MFLGYILHTAVISVNQIGVGPWSLFLWMVWLILHITYKKCFQVLLQKIKIDENEQQRLIKIYWTLVFSAITVPFALQNLSLTLSDIKGDYRYILENKLYQWYNNNDVPSIQVKLSYILLTGFYLNSVCEITIEKGFYNIDFFHSEFLTIFFVSTFPNRCVFYGIALTSLVNLVRFIFELSKLLASISNIVKSKFIKQLAYFVLFIHCFIWGAVFLHILPKYFLFLVLKKMKHKDDVAYLSVFSLLILSLWSYYIMEIYKSPLSTMVTNYIYGRNNNFEDILFNNDSDKLNEDYDQQDVDLIEQVQNSVIIKNMSNHVDKNKHAKENLLALYQTVKCVIRVKRKLKRVREKLKEANVRSNNHDCKELISSYTSD